jgi:uncharacterized protein YjbK
MTEVEVAFLVLCRNQDKVISTLKSLILNEGYLVEQKGNIRISDTYFDTEDKILENRKIGLRVRTSEETGPKLTLKIPMKKGHHDYSERLEIEKPWSKSTLNEIMFVIKSHVNIDYNKQDYDFDNNNHYYHNNDPKSTLSIIGFEVTQQRETCRYIINAVNKKSKQIEYEFSVDNTNYIINKFSICNSELEIELKITTVNGKLQLINFIDKLKQNNKDMFQVWPYSKLVTGKAIENLLTSNELKGFRDFDKDNILTHSGIKKILQSIKLMDI